ncbi:arylsulfatase A-like enzyme [Actinocorallia herbida]|uniref:Arylsulfatase A-like enzyme n=1 Tax=Actinocorallia herbida TaxID=58109 RepID=A0A3N1CWV8_9ACTN|nr:sulfatase-like hydrolase/transferase [Actinocorallia herbida]ROO85777.1 arylsulfatase A-like enzyme [Actinocorallia herbida]
MHLDRVSRRQVLAGVTGGLLAAGPPARAEAAARGPNILWLVSEDNNPYIGAYGDPLARTPTLDRLAAEGIRYENSFSSAPVCAPSRFAILTGLPPETCGPAEHMRAEGNIPGFLRGFPEYLRESGYFCTNNNKTDYNAPFDPAKVWDASGLLAHWRNRPKDAPFFSVFNYMTTHESALFLGGAGRTRPEDVRVPAYLPDTPAIRADRARYYDLMAQLDGQVADRLDELAKDGLAEDTVVFYYSDNGGALPRSKRHCYDSGLRTALIVRFPEKWAHLAPAAPGSVVTAPVTSLDFAPTVLALAGLPAPDHMRGSSLTGGPRPSYAFGVRNRMDERYDMVRTVRDERYRYIRNYSPHRPYGQHQAFAWQQKGYQDWEQAHLDGVLDPVQNRYWRPKPAEELYDLRVDPDEVDDLANEPGHRAVLHRLSAALDRRLLDVNDNGFIPEGSPLEGYEQSRATGAYPLRRVLDLAGAAIRREPGNLPRLVQDLADANEVVRYWAASGLLMLGDAASPAADALALCLSDDPSPQVRIVAAEALARLGRTGDAVPHLADTLDEHPDTKVRLQALNALTYIGDAAEPALPSITRATLSTDEHLRNAARHLWLVLHGLYRPTAQPMPI